MLVGLWANRYLVVFLVQAFHPFALVTSRGAGAYVRFTINTIIRINNVTDRQIMMKTFFCNDKGETERK